MGKFKNILDSILILPTLANVQPPRFVESARKAWRGLQALPEILDYHESHRVKNRDKKIAALERQLAAVCGGLETEKAAHSKTWDGLKRERAAHMEAKRCCDDAILPLSRTIDERNQARAEVANLHETLLVAKRDAWADGCEAGVAFATSQQSTPGGIPIDPPRNPHE